MKRICLIALILLGTAWVRGASPTSPAEFLGFPVGADRRLADWNQMLAYLQELDRGSDRLRLDILGESTLGRPFALAIISAPETLHRLDDYKALQAQLADPRAFPGDAERLVAAGKTVVLVTCGIHSTEVASPQMAMELAYELATARDPDTLEILKDVVLLMVPSLNPDGVDIVTEWYRQTLDTPAEGTSPPRLYHVYTGHDNNRDWYMQTQKETRLTVEKIHRVWRPQIVVDMHQMGAFGARFFAPPYVDPIDPNVDPLLQAQIADLGTHLFARLLGKGFTGVVCNALFDAYTPARAYSHYHGGVRILLEAASARLASPVRIAADELQPGRNYDPRISTWNHPSPWTGGIWRLRDIIDYQKSAVRAALHHAARFRRQWLLNFREVGRRALQRTQPYAFVIPHEQRDPQGLYDLLQVMTLGEVEIEQAQAGFEVAEALALSASREQRAAVRFAPGAYVIRLAQPHGAFAKTLLEIQRYPELRQFPGGPLLQPYDVTAQTLGLQLGVDVFQADRPFEARLRPFSLKAPRAAIQGAGEYWLFSHSNNGFARLINRLLRHGAAVSWAPNGFQAEGKRYPKGTLMAEFHGLEELGPELLEGLPVEIDRIRSRPLLAWQALKKPRIGLYRSHVPVIDEGWTRWILEQNEFTIESLQDESIRETDLSAFDAIIFPHQSVSSIVDGLGVPYPDPYRGGIGRAGVERLRRFAERGGTLVFLGESSRLPLQFWDLPAREVTHSLPREAFHVPGSLLRVRFNTTHPIGMGMAEDAGVMFEESTAFELRGGGLAVARYAEEDLLLSGWIEGSRFLEGKTAVAQLTLGEGDIILIGFRPQFRAQTRHTYKILFNALYHAAQSF